jgi:uncharacterized membrane protein YkvA (DUF1232 family)
MKKKDVFVAAAGLLALVYLINPGAGIFELIPDNIPVVGNLDEAMAAWIVLRALDYFGIEIPFLTSWSRTGRPGRTRLP